MANIQPQLDKNATKNLNLSVLKRQDPDVENVLATAGHVALYQLDLDKMQWSRKEVEGSLFIVKRRSQPLFQFVVLNQRSTENLVQDILGGFQFEISKPYVFYRQGADVNGIWFFSEQECDEVAELIQRIQATFPSESTAQEDGSFKISAAAKMPSMAEATGMVAPNMNMPPAPAPAPAPAPEPAPQQYSFPVNLAQLAGQHRAPSRSHYGARQWHAKQNVRFVATLLEARSSSYYAGCVRSNQHLSHLGSIRRHVCQLRIKPRRLKL
ncbi:hypothetical protein CYMTET_30811 [Cymbomonas tetramitiformis]|uniref:mRNA-decapping enzyme-like protein n=1 Tax=Cymbomonas tetramitiformis TaxID=36881 RepID=A0AAE0FIF8_9CHLO|nr:hypothetical protein CYMTET_30811 [Cymbomonas tetramitiformis]